MNRKQAIRLARVIILVLILAIVPYYMGQWMETWEKGENPPILLWVFGLVGTIFGGGLALVLVAVLKSTYNYVKHDEFRP